MKKIVSDSGLLIALGRINKIALLAEIAGKILIPNAVAEECLSNQSLPGAAAIQKAITSKIIEVRALSDISNMDEVTDLLDRGELEAISLSLNLNIPLLIDEKIGRHVARKKGARITGIGGLLIIAKNRKLVTEIKPIIQELKQNGYYLSDNLVHEILQRAGEKNR